MLQKLASGYSINNYKREMQKFMILGELRFAKAMKTIDDFTYTKISKLVYMIERKKYYHGWNN